MAAPAVANFSTFRAGPLPFVPQNVTRIHVEMPEEATVAEECGAFVAPAATPFRVVNAAEVAKTGTLGVLCAHEVIDCCAESLLAVCCGWNFGLEAHDFAGTIENLSAVFGRDDFGPGVRVGVFARSAIEVAEEAEVEVGALGAADVAVPDGGATKVARCDDSVGECDQSYRCDRRIIYRLVVDHLSKQSREEW